MKKFILWALGIFVVLALALVLVVAFGINEMARSAIVRSGTSVLGVPTTLDTVSIGVFSGNAELQGLTIANPSPFEGSFLDLKSANFGLALRSLFSGPIEITNFTLNSIALDFEQRGSGSNIQTILANIKKATPDEPEAEQPAPKDSEERLYIIDKLKITDIAVTIVLGAGIPIISEQPVDSTISIKQILVTDIGRKEGGVPLNEVMAIVVKSITDAVVQSAPEKLPKLLLRGIQGQLGSLAHFDLGGVKFDAGKGLINLANAFGGNGDGTGGTKDTSEKLKDQVTDGLKKGVGDALDGLFGGEKK